MKDLKDFDWGEIRDALETLLSFSEENEPTAVNFHKEIQGTLDGMPTNDDFD